jgi:hypothetical protein
MDVFNSSLSLFISLFCLFSKKKKQIKKKQKKKRKEKIQLFDTNGLYIEFISLE